MFRKNLEKQPRRFGRDKEAKMWKLSTTMVVLFCILFGMALTSHAGAKKINFMCKLTDEEGELIDGNVTLELRLFTSDNPTVKPWSDYEWKETRTVPFDNGLFNIILGDDAHASIDGVDFSQQLYLGIDLGNGELTPRQPISASGYALGSIADFNVAGKLGVGTGSPSSSIGAANVLEVSGTNASLALHEAGASSKWEILADNDDLKFYRNGAGSHLTIDGSFGYVGIGTTSPESELHISKTASTQIKISGDAGAPNYFGELVFNYKSSTYDKQAFIGALRGTNDHYAHLCFGTGHNANATEKMRITQGGNVGIGTTSPGTKLDVQSSDVTYIRAKNTGTANAHFIADGANDYDSGLVMRENGTDKWLFFNDGNDSDKLRIENASYADIFTINQSGNVGIGTASPGAPLEIDGGSSNARIIRIKGSNLYSQGIEFYNTYNSINQCWVIGGAGGTSGWGRSNGNFIIRDDNTNCTPFEIENGSSNDGALFISGVGKVGIGTAGPGAKLHVSDSNASIYSPVLIQNKSNSASPIDGVGIDLKLSNDNDYKMCRIMAYGETNYNNDMGLAFYTQDDDAGGGSAPTVAPLERMRIDASGNVGIGTTNPGAKLEVNGTIKISGDTSNGWVPADSPYSNYITYHNNSGRALSVVVYGNMPGPRNMWAFADPVKSNVDNESSNCKIWISETQGGHAGWAGFTIVVPPGWYFRFDDTSEARGVYLY